MSEPAAGSNRAELAILAGDAGNRFATMPQDVRKRLSMTRRSSRFGACLAHFKIGRPIADFYYHCERPMTV